MSEPISSHWNSTDSTQPQSEPKKQINVSVPSDTVAHIMVEPNRVSMRIAAFTGIMLVLSSVFTFYFGVDYLAQLVSNETVTITINADGTFTPAESTVPQGSLLSIVNNHAQALTIKSMDDRIAITPVIVFPNEAATLSLDDAALGSYTFGSETLDVSSTFTITIVEDAIVDDEVTTDDSTDENGDILIPMLNEVAPAVSSASSVSSISQRYSSVPVVPLQNFSSSRASLSNTGIPTNPYTVGNSMLYRPSASSSSLHGGAPLKTHRPVSNTGTGPELWLFGLLGLTSIAFVSVKAKSMNN